MSKFALCIGINNYPGTDMDLAGCVNDANDWGAELASRGFSVTTLLDDQATKAAMVEGFKAVIGRAVDGDVVAITFSGHGTYVFDTDAGEESDGFDEALCPHDINATGDPLIDDEIHALFAAREDGVRLVLISDSCHSGTVNRDVTNRTTSAAMPRRRFMPMGNWISAERLLNARLVKPLAIGAMRSGKSAFGDAPDKVGDVLLAGCEEGENHFSYDANIMGRANGAFTFYALKTLRSQPPGANYADWHAALTPECLPTIQYDQTPQIVGGDEARTRPIFS